MTFDALTFTETNAVMRDVHVALCAIAERGAGVGTTRLGDRTGGVTGFQIRRAVTAFHASEARYSVIVSHVGRGRRRDALARYAEALQAAGFLVRVGPRYRINREVVWIEGRG